MPYYCRQVQLCHLYSISSTLKGYIRIEKSRGYQLRSCYNIFEPFYNLTPSTYFKEQLTTSKQGQRHLRTSLHRNHNEATKNSPGHLGMKRQIQDNKKQQLKKDKRSTCTKRQGRYSTPRRMCECNHLFINT